MPSFAAAQSRLQGFVERLKRDALTLWFAYRHPRAPWSARLLGAFVVAYALSPIDLIPDFIPLIGYLDDVVLLTGLIWLALRLLPEVVIEDSRARADRWLAQRRAQPRSAYGAAIVVALWLVCAWLTWESGKWAWALMQP
jgi:uncharacterized membrane protein YkvA (DUF1232 family)